MTSPLRHNVALIVVNYRSSALIEANLAPEEVRPDELMVVIVDNFASREERDRIRSLCRARGWELVANAGNAGFGAGVNHGVERALAGGAEVLITLNPDAVASREVLLALAAEVEANPRHVVAPRIMSSDGRPFFTGSQVVLETGRLRTGWTPGDTDPVYKNWLTGACLAFSKQAYQVTGGFDESYFMYWEDVDFSRRVARAGFTLTLRDDLVIIHDEGGTQRSGGGNAKSPLYMYYNSRNRLLFGARLAPRHRGRYLATTPAESYRVWSRGGRRQLVTRPSVTLAVIRGTLAGAGHLIATRFRRRRRADRNPAGGDQPVTRPGTALVVHPSPDLYGSDRVLLESVAGLVEAGIRVVVALPSDGPLVPELKRHGSEVVLCPTPVLRKSALSPMGLVRLAAEALKALPRARAVVASVAPDLILVNTITIPLWLVAARGGGRRVVCHVHEAERSAPALVRKGLYAPLLLADRLVVNSRFALDVLAGAWPRLRGRADIVANGVPGPEQPEPPRSSLAGGVRLLFIGRLSPRKGPQVAVRALAHLVRSGHEVTLSLLGAVFEGYEWFEQELRDLISAEGLTDRVTFLGFRPDVWQHVRDCDIVVVPSTVDEPFGNTAVEAMLAQRPLVVSATSGLIEAAADYLTARRVPPGDPIALAGAVVDLTENWDRVVAGVAQDRALALARHAPAVYRRTLAATVFSGFEPERGGNHPSQ